MHLFFIALLAVAADLATSQRARQCPDGNPRKIGECGESGACRSKGPNNLCCIDKGGNCVVDIMASNQNQAFLRERLSNVKDEVNPYIPDQQQMQTFQRSANGYTGQRSNQVNSRTLGAFGGGFSGMFGGGPSINNLVVLGLITGNDILPTCPVNVPYCQRTKCGSRLAELNFLECVKRAECCFDFNVYLYKGIFGSRFMAGTPTCHHGATSPLYKQIRNLFPPQLSIWLLGKPIVKLFQDVFDSKILNIRDQLTCTLQQVVNSVEQRACGWAHITSEECALRGCCWITDKCHYPSQEVTNWVGAQSIYPELYSYDGGFSPNTCPNPYSLAANAYKALPCRHEFPDFGNTLELYTWCPQRYCCSNPVAGTSAFNPISTFNVLSNGQQGAGGIGGLIGLGGGRGQGGGGLFGGVGQGGGGLFGGVGQGGGGQGGGAGALGSLLLLSGLGGGSSTGSSGTSIVDLFCPYYFLKLLNLPDITTNTQGCCTISICTHKKIPGYRPQRQAYMTEWAWSACQPCGGQGSKSGSRQCLYRDNNAPAPPTACSGPLQTTQSCQSPPCIAPATFGNWRTWSNCDRPCGGGSQISARDCYYNGNIVESSRCAGQASRSQSCNNIPCQQYKWGSYQIQSPCSVSCGRGNQAYRRSCLLGFNEVDISNCAGLSGGATINTVCVTPECITSNWGPWDPWGDCSVTCGPGTTQRFRFCTLNNGQPTNPGDCQGDPYSISQTNSCNNGPCGPVVNPSPITVYTSQWKSTICQCSGSLSEKRSCFRRDASGSYIPFDETCRLLGVQLERDVQSCQRPPWC